MTLIARVKSWLRVSSRRADFESEMQDEMRIHLELYQADLRRRGVPDEEARRRAFAEFGSVDARKEECRQRKLASSFLVRRSDRRSPHP